MTKSVPKLVLSSSRDIPFSQLVLSQKNVRRVKAGLSIEDLAEDIYRRTLLQSLFAGMSDADFNDQLCAVFSEKNDIRHDCIEPLFQPGMSKNIDFGWTYNLGMSAMLGNNRRNGESLLALKNLFGPYMRIGFRHVTARDTSIVVGEVVELFRALLSDQDLIACRTSTVAK